MFYSFIIDFVSFLFKITSIVIIKNFLNIFIMKFCFKYLLYFLYNYWYIDHFFLILINKLHNRIPKTII